MKNNFEPDYRYLTEAAWNRAAGRTPLYEHNVSFRKIGEILNEDLDSLWNGSERDLEEFFRLYSGFFKESGYDAVTFECCTGGVLPGSGALGNSRITPAIQDRDDFNAYPWDEIPNYYFKTYGKYFRALKKAMPAGMKAVGGVGNGIFECVQDVTGYQNLCYMKADDEELYRDLFLKMHEVLTSIWTRFLKEYGDTYCVLRFGDDLGYKSNTLLSDADIRTHILPCYRSIIDLVHSYRKPFLLHSCGCIFNVMDDLIAAGINAKHSNEDQIAPFSYWVDKYGDRIGNFGGIDMDFVCRGSKQEIREYITDVYRTCSGHGGFAFGTGNSIPDYVPTQNYLDMIEIFRGLRGE